MSGPIGSSQWMYASGEAVTQQSLKFNDDESQYLSWTPAAAGNRKTFTFSCWVKRSTITAGQAMFAAGANAQNRFQIYFLSNDKLGVYGNTSNSDKIYAYTDAVFRDVSAWYNVVVEIDSTDGTAGNRLKMYVNGVEQSYTYGTTPSQNEDFHLNNTVAHAIGSNAYAASSLFDGYLSDINFIDGQALDATSFGQFTNGYWEAIDYAGTYGTNGFHLTFADDVVSEGFNAVTYRGTGASQSISGLGFEPDFVWLKNRSGTNSHVLQDSVRGAGKNLFSNATSAEGGNAGDLIGSFDNDGFTVNDTYLGGSGGGGTNGSGNSYVAWCWDAGSGSAASNTDGSITSTVKANPSYGFSIVTYTGSGANATVGHGLSSAPEMIIIKDRGDTSTWIVYTEPTGNNNLLVLASTSAASSTTNFQSTDPTSSVFSVSTSGAVNGSSSPYIAYCFHSVAGYSSIGSYSGTGASGNAVTGLGFKPAFLMVKRTDAATTYSNWWMQDATRNPTNVGNTLNLAADNSNAETNALEIDFDSDGFTLQDGSQGSNISGATYIYMAFADTREAAFWKDVSGQGNHWTPNNLDYRDSLIDSPANNFATFNPLMYRWVSNTTTLSEGNLKSTGASGYAFGTMNIPTSGKWYFETYTVAGTSVGTVGVGDGNLLQQSNVSDVVYYFSNGNKSVNGTVTSYGATWTTGDVIGVACDADGGTVTFYKNGSSQGSISYDPIGATVFFGNWGTTGYFVVNFGQDSTFAGARPAGGNQDDNGIGDFAYAPPSGYLALCTANLPTPTIGSEHFNTVLYTGNGSTQSITGVGFQPDLVWGKERPNVESNWLFDSIRGATKQISSNSTNGEGTQATMLTSFDSDGFTMGSDGAGNQSSTTYVSWNWKAGGTAVSNTNGSITSQVSANTDAGFSIVSYVGNASSGATIGHGLNSLPQLIIHKNRIDVDQWSVYTEATGTGKKLALDTTGAEASTSNYPTTPTSSVFYVGAGQEVNGSGDDMIAYCFHSSDVCKVGSYTGNGSSDGPMVFTGGRPAWFLVKRSDSGTHHWRLFDAVRSTFNEVDDYLAPSNSNAEAVGKDVDFVSNGVKIRTTDSDLNTSGGTYIYLCIMETPFKFSPAR